MSSFNMSTVDDAPTSTPAEEPVVVNDTSDSNDETQVENVSDSTNDTTENNTTPPQENNLSTSSPPVQNNSNDQGQVNLLNVTVNNENDALNVIIGFLSVAQRRGVFAINESAKIFECVKKFQRPQQ